MEVDGSDEIEGDSLGSAVGHWLTEGFIDGAPDGTPVGWKLGSVEVDGVWVGIPDGAVLVLGWELTDGARLSVMVGLEDVDGISLG